MNTLRYFDFGASAPCCCSSPASPWWSCLSFWLSETVRLWRYGAVHGRLRRADADAGGDYRCDNGGPCGDLNCVGLFHPPAGGHLYFYTLGTAVIGHHYWDMTGDAVLPNMINFWKNVSIAGAFLLLAITGPGAISLDRR